MHPVDATLVGKKLDASSAICAVISVLHQLKGTQLSVSGPDDDTLDDDDELRYLVKDPESGAVVEMDAAPVAGIEALEKLAVRIIRLFTTEIGKFFGFSLYHDGETAVRSLFESAYVSDSIGKGSCAAILLFRILQLLRSSEQHKWDGPSIYAYRLSESLQGEFARFVTQFNALPRGRIDFVFNTNHIVLLPGFHDPPFGLIPSTELPKSPSVYTVRAPAIGPSADSNHWRTDGRPAFTFHRPRQTMPQTPANPSGSQSSITGNWTLDLCVLQYLPPCDFDVVQQINAYYHALVAKYCAVPLEWSRNFTLCIRHFFRKEWGRAHLRLESWGQGNLNDP
ncbi:alpha-12-mannosidase [Perkinsela sp. CCAP 1560/4]|nr:alpha-12-mannosidase [Perkinsela sp. CCAP 1560/4]|eukprot:KNH05455.1 alpha-12-mannosidase [Perkinsela sp. CCAP 1560/4]